MIDGATDEDTAALPYFGVDELQSDDDEAPAPTAEDTTDVALKPVTAAGTAAVTIIIANFI